MKYIAFLVSRGCWAGSVSLVTDLLSMAARLSASGATPSLALDMIALDDTEQGSLHTFSGLQLAGLKPFAQVRRQYHAVFLPTLWQVDGADLERWRDCYPWLAGQYRQGAYLLGTLTGSFLMAEAGVLNGRRATTHWASARLFAERYPEVDLQASQLVTRDGRLLCAGAINAVIDLTFFLIEQFCGSAVAQQCERHCLMGTRRTYLSAPVTIEVREDHNDDLVRQVQAWLASHYAEPFSLEEVAARFCISSRNLRRRFSLACGESLSDYLQRYRIAVARELLASTQLPVSRICFDVGYLSQTVFGRFFKKHTGQTPTDYRHTHGPQAR